MEEKINNQPYQPFPTESLKRLDARSGEFEKSRCRFSVKEERSQRLKRELLWRFVPFLEDEFGELYTRERSAFPDPKWETLFKHLYKTGALAHVAHGQPFNDHVKVFSPTLRHGQVDRKDTDGHISFVGFSRGTSEDYDEALSKAVGEFLERYALLFYKQKNLITASIRHLEEKRSAFLDPQLLCRFSEEQKEHFSGLQYDKDTLFSWVEGENLITKEKILIPAQLVFWTYCRHHPRGLEPQLYEQNTNGAGGYFTPEGAILSGLYEVVQRDGFLLHWFNRAAPKRVDTTSLPPGRTKNLIKEAQRMRFRVHFFDVTTEFTIPAAVCILVDESGGGPMISTGGGCGLDAEEVLRSALLEAVALHQWSRVRNVSIFFDQRGAPFMNELIGQFERVKLWGDPKMFKHIEFFFGGEFIPFTSFAANERRFSNKKRELAYVRRLFRGNGKAFEPAFYHATHPLLTDTGYHAARVIVPGLLPLYLNEQNAPVGSSRIKEGAEKLGLTPAKEINPFPHPFP